MPDIKKETPEETAQRLAALMEKTQRFMKYPWTLYHAPFRVADNLFYVGNTYVASYLVDTGEGLVLIDCGFGEVFYQLVHNIHRAGYDPADIKYIFLSHGHFDHCGATRLMQELCQAPVYIGEGDRLFFTQRRDLIVFEDHAPEFEIAGSYDYQTPWTIGNTTFRFLHTPGHTPGCTTFLMDTTHRGQPVTCAMHGGLGLNGLTYQELDDKRLPRSLHQAFYDQLLMCRDLKVDITCPSHNHDYDILALAEKDDGTGDVFVDPTGWRRMIDSKIEKYLPLL